jgi:hypothetical protein
MLRVVKRLVAYGEHPELALQAGGVSSTHELARSSMNDQCEHCGNRANHGRKADGECPSLP